MADPKARTTVEDRVAELEARLAQFEAQLERTRSDAERALQLLDDRGPRWVDSGTIHPELDDQAIAPPG